MVGGVLENGSYRYRLPTRNEVYVTTVIFFNGVVPWPAQLNKQNINILG